MSGAIAVAVKPRASRAGVSLAEDGSVIVHVHAPAAEGKANRECVEALAAALGVPRGSVRIVQGERSRRKQLAVEGMTAAQVRERVAEGEKRARR